MFDLWLQFNRLLLIVFVVERTKLFLLLISLALFITVLSTMYDPLMVTPNTCYSFDNNDDGTDIGNITCMQKHSNENYIFQYRIFLTNIIWISGATTISISAISFGNWSLKINKSIWPTKTTTILSSLSYTINKFEKKFLNKNKKKSFISNTLLTC